MSKIYLSWSNFKNLFISKQAEIQFVETPEKYDIFFNDSGSTYSTEIWIDTTIVEDLNVAQNNADRSDFETNFKSSSNTKSSRLASDVIPQRAQKVENRYLNSIAGLSDRLYVIPAGKKLVLQRLKAGSSLSLGTIVSTKIELFFDPNGDGSVLQPIDTAYISVSPIDSFLNKDFLGDGVAAIRTRRAPLDVGSREVFVQWEGYLI